VLSLDELIAFFEHPARQLLRRRLGIDLGERALDVPDREPVELTPLDRYRIGDQLLALCLGGMDARSAAALVRAAGQLPLGSPGRCAFEDIATLAEPLARRLERLRRGRAEPFPVDVILRDGTRVGGQIDEVWEPGPVVGQFARVSGRSLLSLWIRHLAYCLQLAAGGRPCKGRSYLVGRAPGEGDGIVELCLRPVERPESLLADLIELERIGQREPLRLLPKVAYRYARTIRHRGEERAGQALDTARGELDTEHARDPHLRRAFADLRVLEGVGEGTGSGPSFAELARRVFDPLLDHLDEGS
jgi:exodeoxyribonuclease V gamma subunit